MVFKRFGGIGLDLVQTFSIRRSFRRANLTGEYPSGMALPPDPRELIKLKTQTII